MPTNNSTYDQIVKAIKYRGKTLQQEEKVPSGSPLTMIDGSGNQSDSLSTEREYIVSPDRNTGRQEQNSNVNSQEGANIDESFF